MDGYGQFPIDTGFVYWIYRIEGSSLELIAFIGKEFWNVS